MNENNYIKGTDTMNCIENNNNDLNQDFGLAKKTENASSGYAKKKTWGTARNLVEFINRKLSKSKAFDDIQQEIDKAFCRGIVYALKAEGYRIEYCEAYDCYIIESRDDFQDRKRNENSKPYYRKYSKPYGNRYGSAGHYNNGSHQYRQYYPSKPNRSAEFFSSNGHEKTEK